AIKKTLVKTLNEVINIRDLSLCDSYSESNFDTLTSLYAGGTEYVGQSFTNTNVGILNSCKLLMSKDGSPSGIGTAKIYAHTGTYGTDGTPTGAALATSDNFDVTSLTEPPALYNLTFSGANRIILQANTKYVIVMSYGGGDSSNKVYVGLDSSSPTHSGNFSYSANGSSWNADSGIDICFYVYTNFGLIKKTLKTFSETVLIVDSLLKQSAKVLLEVVSIIDTLSIKKVLHKTLSEIITIADSIANKTIKVLSEAITIIDSISIKKVLVKTLSEIISIAD
ncbi:MAG: hypothetical protein GWP10_07215, partial [Nitrospiraceae bacterium]|nr:hypothetical protein [Nitrospiraceae bacterium]